MHYSWKERGVSNDKEVSDKRCLEERCQDEKC
jgi:hypothetical protein